MKKTYLVDRKIVKEPETESEVRYFTDSKGNKRILPDMKKFVKESYKRFKEAYDILAK